MTKCAIKPTIAGYSVKPGNEVLEVQLDGGLPRIRKDVLHAATRVSVSWIVTNEEYNYLLAFYHTTTVSGSLPFTIDLVIDGSTKASYTAHFVPQSFQHSKLGTNMFSVSADLYVEVIARNATTDAALVTAYNTAHGVS